jgi:transposase InsO family protein
MTHDTLELCTAHLNQFTIKDEQLLHKTAGKDSVPYLKYSGRQMAIKRFHEGLGHLKYASIIDLLKRRYWWPNMDADVKAFIALCQSCQLDQAAGTDHHPVPLRPVPPAALPFERWGIDFVQDLPITKAGNRHIITAIDYATRWVITKAVPERTSQAVAEFLYEQILMQYGAPYEIITDRASAFLSAGMKEYEQMQRIKHLATTPYHPQTNGMVERMHSMLSHAITTLTQSHPDRWDEYLPEATFAIRVRTHAVTRYSPFYLLYGVKPRLPGDTAPLRSMMQPLDELEQMEEKGEFTAHTLEQMGQDRAAAYERSKTQAERMKRKHGLQDDPATNYFHPGDWVKLRNYTARKFEYDWQGPLQVVDVGFPGTYWLMTPDGRRFRSTVAEHDLAPYRLSEGG